MNYDADNIDEDEYMAEYQSASDEEKYEYNDPLIRNTSKIHNNKYITDGFDEKEYKQFNTLHMGLVQAECCHRWFNSSAFEHQYKFSLTVPGMNTCIHCYIDFNSHIYMYKSDLVQNEGDCLKYYIENFSFGHNSDKCIRKYGDRNCVLCGVKNGYMPPFLQNLNIQDSQDISSGIIVMDRPESWNDYEPLIL